MTEILKPTEADKPTQKRKPPAQGAAAVAQVLESFALMPFHGFAEGRNQSMRSLLQEVTGLSKARIANGNIGALRPSTEQKIDKHMQRWLEKEVNNPEVLACVREKIASSPLTLSGAQAPLAGWLHMSELQPELPLSISKAVALVIDELVEALLNACRAGDLSAYQQIWLAHFEQHGEAVRIGGDPVALPAADAELDLFRVIASWEDSVTPTKKVMDHLYIDVITALDAEWSSYYFCGRQSMPLFPLVMVRLQDGLMESKRATSRKNVVYRPSRRLLEFLYALVYLVRYKKWPSSPPTPKKLAVALGEESSLISNHFDGSRKLTLKMVIRYWNRMLAHFMPERNEGQRPNPPFPLIELALQWQSLLIRDKGKTIFLFDHEEYNTLWCHRRQQWLANQAEPDGAELKIGHPKNEAIEWPAWMLSQSSSSLLST
jgi:hypothetical protein